MPKNLGINFEQPATQDEHPQEKLAKVAYGELGKGESPVDTWGVVDYKGKYTNLYWDKQINKEIFTAEILKRAKGSEPLRIVDFGGAEGKLLREIFDDLRTEGLAPIGATIDPSLQVGKTRASWDSYKAANPEARDRVIGIPANFITESEKINVHEGTLDFALSRFVAQYAGKGNLPSFFKEQVKYLKEDGTLICEWPTATESDQQLVNEFWGQFARITEGIDPKEYAKRQFYPTIEEVKEAAESEGLKVTECGVIEEMNLGVYETALSNGSRFKKLNEEQKKALRELFIDLAKKYPNQISYDAEHDSYHYNNKIGKLIANKVSKQGV